MTKNIFITGGLGQDGQIITNLLKNKNVNTYIFSKYKKNRFLKKIKFIKTNLLNKKKLDKFFSKIKPDIVLHLAANNPSFFNPVINLPTAGTILIIRDINLIGATDPLIFKNFFCAHY